MIHFTRHASLLLTRELEEILTKSASRNSKITKIVDVTQKTINKMKEVDGKVMDVLDQAHLIAKKVEDQITLNPVEEIKSRALGLENGKQNLEESIFDKLRTIYTGTENTRDKNLRTSDKYQPKNNVEKHVIEKVTYLSSLAHATPTHVKEPIDMVKIHLKHPSQNTNYTSPSQTEYSSYDANDYNTSPWQSDNYTNPSQTEYSSYDSNDYNTSSSQSCNNTNTSQSCNDEAPSFTSTGKNSDELFF